MSFRMRNAPVFVSNTLMDNTIVAVTPQNDTTIIDNTVIDIREGLISKTNKTIFATETNDYHVPLGTKQFYISMVAGGGAGGLGDIKGDLFHSGGGGGAGGCYSRIPVKIENKSPIKLHCTIGKGGTRDHHDGTDTVVQIYVNNILYTTLNVIGGKGGGGGTSNDGGEGGPGLNIFNGNGEKGTVNLSRHVPKGGKGGSSIFYNGGKGMTYNIQNKEECNGKWGSGGGGSIPLIENQTNNGGDGIVTIEYVEV